MSEEFGLEPGEFSFEGDLFDNENLFDELLDDLEFDEAARGECRTQTLDSINSY